MSDDEIPPAGEPSERTDFDWQSPRWREVDGGSMDDQRRRRFRDHGAPRQRGAIDAGGSVPSSAEARSPGRTSPEG